MATIDLHQRLISFGDQALELTPESLSVALDQPDVEWIGQGTGWGTA